jgi:hypothetical protein
MGAQGLFKSLNEGKLCLHWVPTERQVLWLLWTEMDVAINFLMMNQTVSK